MKRLLVAGVALLALAFALTACGGSSGSSTDGSSVEASSAKGVQSQEGTIKAKAEEAGVAAAKAAGKGKLPANVTVGVVNIFGGFESAVRVMSTVEQAAKTIGFKTVSCDAEGVPAKMQSCTSSMVSQHVNVIFTLAIEPSIIAPQLKAAQEAEIPVINFAGTVVPSPLFTGSYYMDDKRNGECAGEWLGEQLPEGGEVAVSNYPAIWAEERTEGFEAGLKKVGSKAELTDETTADATNLVPSIRKQMADTLTQHPEVSAFWFPFDTAGQAAVSVIAQQSAGREPPVITVSVHADPGTQELIRNGEMTAVCDVNYDGASWVAINEAAELLGHGKVASAGPGQEIDGYPIYSYQMITKENLPPKGQYVQPQTDPVTFFTTKWKEQWGR